MRNRRSKFDDNAFCNSETDAVQAGHLSLFDLTSASQRRLILYSDQYTDCLHINCLRLSIGRGVPCSQ